MRNDRKVAVIVAVFIVCSLSICNITKKPLPAYDQQTIQCCQTSDTLMELVNKGSALMRSWYGNGIVPLPDSFAASLAAITDSLLSAHGNNRDTGMVPVLKNIVYNKWGIRFKPMATSIGTLLPQSLTVKKEGTCLGISLLFLLAAEKFKCPFYGVLLPGHFFVRFDNGQFRRNIEPNAGGIERSEAYYRERYSLPDSIRQPLRNLTKKETAGVFYYTLGNICRDDRKPVPAKKCYAIAIKLFPAFTAAYGNLAILLSKENAFNSAKSLLDKAAAIDPNDPNIWQNFGALMLLQNKNSEALSYYRRGLAQAPENPTLLYGASVCSYNLQLFDRAKLFLQKLHDAGDTSQNYKSLKRKLSDKQ